MLSDDCKKFAWSFERRMTMTMTTATTTTTKYRTDILCLIHCVIVSSILSMNYTQYTVHTHTFVGPEMPEIIDPKCHTLGSTLRQKIMMMIITVGCFEDGS